MDKRFEGKVVVITGAAGDDRPATARRLAAEGARLALVDVAAGGLAESLAAVREAGSEAITVESDVTRSGEVARYVAAAVERWGVVTSSSTMPASFGAMQPPRRLPRGCLRPRHRGQLQGGVAGAQARRGRPSSNGRRGHREHRVDRRAPGQPQPGCLHREQARRGGPHPHRGHRADPPRGPRSTRSAPRPSRRPWWSPWSPA